MSRLIVLMTTAVLLSPVISGTRLSAAEELPPGVEQIIPRGQIAAIVDAPVRTGSRWPRSRTTPGCSGRRVDGQARAYSLNLLNRHEVVNDTIGGRPLRRFGDRSPTRP